MEVLKAANEREADGTRVMHMEVGEPGAGTPAKVLAAAAQALKEDPLGYTEALGLPELRRAITGYYRDAYGLAVPVERIAVTTGSSGGFLLTLVSAFDAGDRIGLGVPYYPAYRNMLQALDLEAVPILTTAQSGFQPTPEQVARAAPLDGLLVASPANPTGSMLNDAELSALCACCEADGIRLISDEIYHGIIYGEAATSALAHSANAVVLNGFSKYFCMTGWRLGWMVLPDDLLRPVERIAQNLFVSPPNISQRAAVAAFGCGAELDANVAVYAENRRLLLDKLPKIGIKDLAPADGAFYVFANVSHLTNDSAEWCRRVLDEAAVAMTPGVDFDPERGAAYVRVSFAGSTEDVVETIRRLRDWLA